MRLLLALVLGVGPLPTGTPQPHLLINLDSLFLEKDAEESSEGQLLNRVVLIKTLLDHQRRATVGDFDRGGLT